MSKPFSLNKKDLVKVGEGALIAMGGAGLTYLATVVNQIDFGVWTPLVVAALSVLTNLVKKFLTDTTK